MDLLREITENNIVAPSLCDFLFGEDEDSRDDLFDTTCDYPKILYNVCLFYFALLQRYLIDCAQKKECLLEKLGTENIYKEIVHTWKVDKIYFYEKENDKIFSLLMDCTEIDDPNIFSEEALSSIKTVRDAFQRYDNNHIRVRHDLISEQEFLSLLKSFKLLQYTNIDRLSKTITFSVPNQKAFTIDYRPFIFFIDPETELQTDDPSGLPYIMVSAMKGERDQEIRFNVVELNSFNIIPRSVVIRRPVDENLRLICKTLDLNIRYYPPSELMVDFKFLMDLTEIAEDVVVYFLEYDHGDYKENDIFPAFREMFINTDLYDKIKDYSKITKHNISKLLFDFFIKFGVFETMWSLLLDSEVHTPEKMFIEFLKAFKEKGKITKFQYDDYISECDKSIETHISKLETIVIKQTSYFLQRSKEINAEWRAFYVLKAAGIKNEKLFADVENVLSLDDYFDMINNPHTESEQDIKNVLSFLISFYSPFAGKNFKYQDDSYARAVEQSQCDLAMKSHTVSELFDIFIEIVNTVNENRSVEPYLGREDICRPNLLNYYKSVFERDSSQELPPQEPIHEKRIFISYAHEDMEKVRGILNLLKVRLPQFLFDFDEEMWDGGDIWRNGAMNAIRYDNCVGVIVFMSEAAAMSEPVQYELEYAKSHAEKKYPGNLRAQQKFIIPINFEERSISKYLTEKSFSEDASIQQIALKLQKVIPDSKIFYRADDPKSLEKTLDDLVQYFERLLDEDDSTGSSSIITDFKGEFLNMANFYTFLKTGNKSTCNSNSVLHAFETADFERCIFPLVVSVKETRIKRDNVTLLAYEIVKGKGRGDYSENYILSSKKLKRDEYYCIPNYRYVGDGGSWMIEPFIVPHEYFTKQK